MEPSTWRLNHPKCKFCQYLKFVSLPAYFAGTDYYRCIAKDKIINYIGLPRYFCSCYKVKLEDLKCEKS